MNTAVRQGCPRENHFRTINPLPEKNIIERILTPAEEKRLLIAANRPLRNMFRITLNTCIRLAKS